MRVSVATLIFLAASVTANRDLKQMSAIPTFQGQDITFVNADNPALQQGATAVETPQLAPKGESTFLPVVATPAASVPGTNVAGQPTQQTSAETNVPAQAPQQSSAGNAVPAQAPQQGLPVYPTPPSQAPAQAPVTVPTPPAPAPAQAQPQPVPVPAPFQYALPSFQVPVPAPLTSLTPAPAPAPISPPLCGVQPQCRLFVEDMLCCENTGAVTDKTHAVLRLQCTHEVNYYPKCFNASISGPANHTAFSQFETAVWSKSHAAQIDFESNYTGNVTLDIERVRNDAILSADCGLYVTPCIYEGQTVTKVQPVLGFSYTAIDNEDFMDVSDFVGADLADLDSLVFPNLFAPQTCQQKNTADLNSTFFNSSWPTFTAGDVHQCNYTAFQIALAPAPSSTISTQPINTQVAG